MTKDKLTFTIDLNNLTFKDIAYLSLDAEEKGSLHNDIYSFNIEFKDKQGNNKFCVVNHDDSDFTKALKLIEESKRFFLIIKESDIDRLRSINFNVVSSKFTKEQIDRLIQSNLSDSMLLELLFLSKVEVVGFDSCENDTFKHKTAEQILNDIEELKNNEKINSKDSKKDF